VDIGAVAAQAAEVARPLFQERHQVLTVDVPAGLIVVGDHARLVQSLTNLLTNAAKFSADREETRLSAERCGDRVVIRVRDRGKGIEAEMLDRVFDLFEQRGQAADRAQSGLGLGLTIVRNLVTLHGGTVHAESDGPGKGTAVVIELPASIEASRPSARSSADRARPATEPDRERSVLIVDDNEDARRSLSRLLRAYGFEVTAVCDGPAALAAAEQLNPRVVLVDIGLPGMDGYELAGALRRAHPAQELIAITGYGQPTDLVRSRHAGFAAHLVKPVELETLLPLLERATEA
jgi:CheY-like chemotaxis protein